MQQGQRLHANASERSRTAIWPPAASDQARLLQLADGIRDARVNVLSSLSVVVDEDHRLVFASAHSVLLRLRTVRATADAGGVPGAAVGRSGPANLQGWMMKAAAGDSGASLLSGTAAISC